MPSLYRAFGLTLQASRPIPGLRDSSEKAAAFDIYIDLESGRKCRPRNLPGKLWYQSPKDPNNTLLTVWRINQGTEFYFRYSDGIEFRVHRSGGRISAAWPEAMTLEDMAAYLLGPVIGFVLQLRGVVCLHASAVAVDNCAVAFLNPLGHGKSTIAAAFALQGHPVLSDDIVTLVVKGNAFFVQPALPRLRLWPASTKALFGSAEALPRISPEHPQWDKRFLALTGDRFRFQQTPLPLAAVYKGRQNESLALPQLESMPERKGFLILLANTYADHLFNKEMRARQFEVLSRLVKHIPLKYFWTRKGFQYLPLLCDAVRNDVMQMQSRQGSQASSAR